MTDNQLQKQWELLSEEVKSLKTEFQFSQKKHKSESKLNALKLRRIVEAIVFGIIAIFLAGYIAGSINSLPIAISGVILMIFVMIGLIGNILQIAEIMQIDFSQPVALLQKQLGRLKLFNLNTLKLVFMSVPFYLAYPIILFDLAFGVNLFEVASPVWIYVNLGLSLLLLISAVWFFQKVSYDSPIGWVRRLIQDNGGKEIEEVVMLSQE